MWRTVKRQNLHIILSVANVASRCFLFPELDSFVCYLKCCLSYLVVRNVDVFSFFWVLERPLVWKIDGKRAVKRQLHWFR